MASNRDTIYLSEKTSYLLSAEFQYQGIHSGILTVYFKSGGIRAYHGVEPNIWFKLKSDESPGNIYVKEVKEKYRVVVIRATRSKNPKPGGQFKIPF